MSSGEGVAIAVRWPGLNGTLVAQIKEPCARQIIDAGNVIFLHTLLADTYSLASKVWPKS